MNEKERKKYLVEIGNRIKNLRTQEDLTQEDLALRCGYTSRSTINKIEMGINDVSQSKLKDIATALGVPVGALLGNDEIGNSDPQKTASQNSVRIPVLGSVPAGIAIDAIEDIVDWEEIPKTMTNGAKEYFGLIVKGDSMYPKYMDHDVVIVLKQPTCESHDDCIVYVNGFNATLKTVIKNDDGSITLKPINPEYPPRTFDPDELKTGILAIAGVVVEIRRKVK